MIGGHGAVRRSTLRRNGRKRAVDVGLELEGMGWSRNVQSEAKPDGVLVDRRGRVREGVLWDYSARRGREGTKAFPPSPLFLPEERIEGGSGGPRNLIVLIRL